MRIEDTTGQEINKFSDWAKIYDTPQQSHHWKKGRSAYSAAEFFMNQNGAEAIRSRVSDAIGKTVSFDRAVPEYEVRFDDYGRGRVHDVGIFGTTDSDESVFVGVEAKVDESFGGLIRDEYLKRKAKQITGTSTNAPERIEKLLAEHFSAADTAMFDLRYQLLYSTVGTIAAGAGFSVLYVAVFDTNLYDESIGAENYRDYVQFINAVGGKPLKLATNEALGHQLELREKKLYCLHEKFEL